jgi:two-component system sensor histidine kinase UhpB
MYKQLKKIPTLVNRKNGLLLVLFVLIAFLAFFLCFHSSIPGVLTAEVESFIKTMLLPGDQRVKRAYSIAAISFLMFFIIAYLLVLNITRRKKINNELVMLKEYYCIAMNTISEGLITTGKKGEIFYMNPVAERLTGWTRLEAQNLPLEKVYDVVNEESGKSFEHIVSRILKKGEKIVYENNTMLHAKNKKKLIIRNNGAPLFDRDGNISGTVLTFNDVTERKKIENRLKRSLKLNKGMINSLSSRIVVINVSGTIIKVNKPWNTFEQPRGIVTLDNFGKGTNYFDVWKGECNTAPGIPEKVMTGIKKVLDGSLDEFYLEYPCFSTQRDSWFSMLVTKFVSAEALAVIELHDITERKNTEEKMQKAIERYDILARATSDTIWDWDIISNKMLYNASITKMFGYEKAEITNVLEWWDKNIHPDDFMMVSRSLAEVFDNKLETIQLEYRFRCADGTYKHIYDRAFVIYGEDHKAIRVIGSMQDITYKKDEEERISRAIINAQEQERCHIGLELHDNVNQILAGTHLTLSMAKDKLIEREKMIEFIDISKDYITNAIDELRKLSHELVPASFDDSTLRNDFENLLLDINLNNQFDVYFHFDEGINNAVGEDIQINLYRILQEQVKNIVDYSGADRIEIVLTLNNGVVRMRTFDNGKGFNTRHIKKGIGLSNMKKRADSFSGKFFLNSSPGDGCEIIVEIPVSN